MKKIFIKRNQFDKLIKILLKKERFVVYYLKFIIGLWKICNKIKIKFNQMKEISIRRNKFNEF